MEILTNNYSISELLGMLRRGELEVNRDYQRGSGLWPQGARSYFIDTILNKFPFPKVYFFEVYDRLRGDVRKELVDGQQRITTIADFVAGKFGVTGESPFAGKKFSDLDDDEVQAFMSYSVSADVIRNASRGEILQMFRRMNAYTLPLNEAEKRHSSFNGEFKWFVNDLSDALSDFLARETFTNRQIVRLSDAELISEIVLAMERGVVSTSPADLRDLYRRHDDHYEGRARIRTLVVEQFRTVGERIPGVLGTLMMKPYALHSLIVCLIHLASEVNAISRQLVIDRPRRVDWEGAESNLIELARAHEAKENEGPHSTYVWGCSAGTNRAGRRLARMTEIFSALGAPVLEVLDADLARLLPRKA